RFFMSKQKTAYDIRWLFRTIMNTRAYQRQSRSTQSAPGRTLFASNCPSRLRSDQILDTLVQVLHIPLDGPRTAGWKADSADKDKMAAFLERLRRNGPRMQFNNVFGFDPSIPNDEVLGTIPQALLLMNGQMIQRGIKASPNTLLGDILTRYPDNRAALEALYLQVLARRPGNEEVKTCGAYVMRVADRREAFEDILWALVNST